MFNLDIFRIYTAIVNEGEVTLKISEWIGEKSSPQPCLASRNGTSLHSAFSKSATFRSNSLANQSLTHKIIEPFVLLKTTMACLPDLIYLNLNFLFV